MILFILWYLFQSVVKCSLMLVPKVEKKSLTDRMKDNEALLLVLDLTGPNEDFLWHLICIVLSGKVVVTLYREASFMSTEGDGWGLRLELFYIRLWYQRGWELEVSWRAACWPKCWGKRIVSTFNLKTCVFISFHIDWLFTIFIEVSNGHIGRHN